MRLGGELASHQSGIINQRFGKRLHCLARETPLVFLESPHNAARVLQHSKTYLKLISLGAQYLCSYQTGLLSHVMPRMNSSSFYSHLT